MYYEFRLDNAVTQRNSAGLDLPCPARLFAAEDGDPKTEPFAAGLPSSRVEVPQLWCSLSEAR